MHQLRHGENKRAKYSEFRGFGSERENFKELLKIFVDSFRQKNPQTIKFSWWSNMFKSRSKNNGWRIDYFLVDKSINFMDADILDHIQGSDHAPALLSIPSFLSN